MGIAENRLRALVALCGGSDRLVKMLEDSYRMSPGKPKEWHINRIEQQLSATAAALDSCRDRLVSMCHGDQAMAERLAAHSRRRAASELEAWQCAIDALLRDRGALYADALYR